MSAPQLGEVPTAHLPQHIDRVIGPTLESDKGAPESLFSASLMRYGVFPCPGRLL